MFEAGGEFAPYSPESSVESGEIVDDGDDVEMYVPPSSLPPRHLPAPKTFVSLALCRVRERVSGTGETAFWFEFLMENKKGQYQFPATFMLEQLIKRYVIRPIHDLETFFQTEISSGSSRLRLYEIPISLTQNPNKVLQLHGSPRFAWICESELAVHTQMGEPSAFGLPIAQWALSLYFKLPAHKRFASASPPLVLYHGTDKTSVPSILSSGLTASTTPGMMGHGIYFAQWAKAVDFALHDALNVPRAEPGCVVRCIVQPGPCYTLSGGSRCACGCGKINVDHNGVASRGYRTVFVPNNTLGATRRAEWCVKDPDAVFIQGIFSVGGDKKI